jgi:phospholipid/cholesterol/gamma-HCH transport system substrate-binding protein
MRRSVREALVGFTILAAITAGLGLWFWLRGVSLRRDTWRIQASFSDAAGLAERSPVYFRGVLVGSVRRIEVTDRAVLADLDITDPRLRLSRPVVARVSASSLLGGDAIVSLISSGKPLPKALPGPRQPRCDNSRMVCKNGKVEGVAAATLDSVTETVQRLLLDAEEQQLFSQMAAATKSFQKATGEAEQLSQEGQIFVKDAQRLVNELTPLVNKADPILKNLTNASAEAAAATTNVKKFTAALENPKTVANLQDTLANARDLTARWDAVGRDVRRLTADESFIDGIRSVSVGLGRFFEDLYPEEVNAARRREALERTLKEEAKQRRREAEDRLAPRSRVR